MARGDWLKSVHSVPTRQYRLLAFEYEDALNEELSISSILRRGEDLLVSLLENRNSTHVLF